MQLRIGKDRAQRLKVALVALAGALAAYALRDTLLRVAGLALGAAIICFVSVPVARVYENRLSRPGAALAALATLGLAAGGVAWLLLPTTLRELMELARTLPDAVARLSLWLERASDWLGSRLPGVGLPALDPGGLQGAMSGIAERVAGLAVNLAGLVGRLSMMAVLAYFFLRDRDRLLLRLELLLPQSFRHTAVRTGNAVCRELRLYLRGQLLIAAAVALLSVAGLMIVGVRGALALGLLIGLLNMVPYFGPYIGGAPAVLIALGDGWKKAALTALALAVVQQLDGSWISPRVMGSLTGFSPALVLVGIYAGARLGGVTGMLFALPLMMTVRTSFRIFVQKYENN